MKTYRKISVLALTALVAATGLTGCSEDALETNQYGKGGVNILAFGPMPITRGETMRLTGTSLNEVREVIFPEGNQKLSPSTTFIPAEFKLNSSEEMLVTIPDMCVPGKLRLVTRNGDTIVSKANITFNEEIKVSSFDPSPVHPGDVITIKGEFVWNIGQVVFFDHVTVDAENFLKNTRNEIQLVVPMEAISGELAYNDGTEGAENMSVGTLNVDAAEAKEVSKAEPEFNETITITGENLDLVESVSFPSVPDVEFTTAPDGKSIQVVVPSNTVSGSIIMKSASGLTTSVDIKVPLATVSGIEPVKDLKAGQTVTITGEKLDRITKVILPVVDPLEKGQFTQTSTSISFVVPEGMGDGKITLVQHENYSIETEKVSMYSDAPEMTIWNGSTYIGNWSGSMSDLAYGAFDWSTVVAGQVLTIYLTPDYSGGYSQIRIGNGSWAALPGTSDVNDLAEADTKFSVTLTQAMIDELVNANGLVLCGAYFTVTKVTLSILETNIWSGSWECSGWGGNQDLAWGGFDWSTIAPNSKVIIAYKKINPGAWGCISLRHGQDWGALPAPIPGQYDLDSDEGVVEVTFTQEIIDDLVNNGGLVLTGDNYILTKISAR